MKHKQRLEKWLGALLIGTALLCGGCTHAEDAVRTVQELMVPFEEITVQEAEVSDRFYYRQLNEEQQLLYKELLQGVQEAQESIYVHSGDTEEIADIYERLCDDFPELFWCAGALKLTSSEDYAEIRPEYSASGDERMKKQKEIEAAAAECLSGISAEASDYERIRYVFEYLVDTVDYDERTPDNQNIYSALVGRASVCAGYSRAAQYLLHEMGIECIYVTGHIRQGGTHAWNIVKCDGAYYQMDVTFGDPVFQNEEEHAGMPEGSINYGYLCCTDAELFADHIPDDRAQYPVCDSMEYNYFVLNDMYYEDYNRSEILEDMKRGIFDKASVFTCKFPNAALYAEARDDILEYVVPEAAQTLGRHYGLNTVNYAYSEDEAMNALTIYWNYS